MIATTNNVITKDFILLVARVLMMLLFVLFGWQKLVAFSTTANYLASLGLPLPIVASSIAVLVELGFGVAIVLGLLTQPLALLLALYTVATGFIGHAYWDLSGTERFAAEINFYKNVALAGGFLLLSVTGAGKYSLDALGLRERKTDQLVTRF
jgi:putative oxidoreductase